MASVELQKVTVWLCALCLSGAGGECRVPGCVFYLNRAPDFPVTIYPELQTASGSAPGAEH